MTGPARCGRDTASRGTVCPDGPPRGHCTQPRDARALAGGAQRMMTMMIVPIVVIVVFFIAIVWPE
jgi:hypothetical protein